MNQISSAVKIRHTPNNIFLLGLLSGVISSVTSFIVTYYGGFLMVLIPSMPDDAAETMAWSTVLLIFLGIPALFVLGLVITISVDLFVRGLNSSTKLLPLSIILGIIIGVFPSVGYLVYMAINIFNHTPGF